MFDSFKKQPQQAFTELHGTISKRNFLELKQKTLMELLEELKNQYLEEAVITLL